MASASSRLICHIATGQTIEDYKASSCDSIADDEPNDSLPDGVETLKRLLRARDAELARARAEALSAEALIAHLRLTIEKMRREITGRAVSEGAPAGAEELQLEELEARLPRITRSREGGDRLHHAGPRLYPQEAFAEPFPAHLPRERIIVPGPTACACCGSTKLAKLGENVTETLEVVPRQWKVVQHVRRSSPAGL